MGARVKQQVHIITGDGITLTEPERFFASGYDPNKTSGTENVPEKITGNSRAKFINFNRKGSAYGACGVVRYRINNSNEFIYCIWSNPFDHNRFNNHVAVAIMEKKPLDRSFFTNTFFKDNA